METKLRPPRTTRQGRISWLRPQNHRTTTQPHINARRRRPENETRTQQVRTRHRQGTPSTGLRTRHAGNSLNRGRLVSTRASNLVTNAAADRFQSTHGSIPRRLGGVRRLHLPGSATVPERQMRPALRDPGYGAGQQDQDREVPVQAVRYALLLL